MTTLTPGDSYRKLPLKTVQTGPLRFDRLRQGSIDEELFDVVSGYELLSEGRRVKYMEQLRL